MESLIRSGRGFPPLGFDFMGKALLVRRLKRMLHLGVMLTLFVQLIFKLSRFVNP